MNKTAVYEGKNISYQTFGKGPAVVLLHGFGEDGNLWGKQISFLESSFQVIVPYLPGSGSSELVEDMRMEGMAGSIHFILQQEKVEQCTMVGHSMGGYITLAFAEKYPHLLDGFGLFHSTAFADSEEKKISRKEGIKHIEEKGALSFLKKFVPNLYSSYTKETRISVIEDHINGVSYLSKAALISYFQSMMERPDRTHVLQQNKMPVLFVLSKEDTAIPFQDVLKLASMPYISYIHILEHSGHMGMIEEPEKSNRLLNDFLLKTI